MTPPLPTGLSGGDIAKALGRAGFQHISTRGSHAKYRSGDRTVIVPLHGAWPWAPSARSSGKPAGPPMTSLPTSS
jgi:predicted RNA binding protein YcfA (HicA-like mRNA interferase family)